MLKKIGIISSFIILIDQIIKKIVVHFCTLEKSLTILPSFFSITYVQNTGAAWSIFSGNRIFLIAVGISAFFLIYFFLLKNSDLKPKEIWIYSMLIGGLFGNLIDRIFLGYVVDYLDFTIGNYHYPIFNFADICIVFSVLFLLLFTWKEGKNENRSK